LPIKDLRKSIALGIYNDKSAQMGIWNYEVSDEMYKRFEKENKK